MRGWAYFTWTVPAAVAVLLWLARRRFPWLVAAAALFCVGVAPVLGLVPFDFQNFSTVCDHYLYFAMFGPALAAAFVLNAIAVRPTGRVASRAAPRGRAARPSWRRWPSGRSRRPSPGRTPLRFSATPPA